MRTLFKLESGRAASGSDGVDAILLESERYILTEVGDRISLDEAAAGYTASAVHFDGTTALHSASLTAGADTQYLLMSFWFKIALADFNGIPFWEVDPENAYSMGCEPGSEFTPERNSVDLFALADETGGAHVNTNVADAAPVAVDAWHHVLGYGQTNLAAGNKILLQYIDDVPYAGGIIDVSDSFLMTFTGKSLWINSNSFGDFNTGDFADIWIGPGQTLDLSIEANRRKFISADGKPVDLGADGSTPTGTAPAIFFSGNSSGFPTNKGTGGTFTLTGSLTNASTSPSD